MLETVLDNEKVEVAIDHDTHSLHRSIKDGFVDKLALQELSFAHLELKKKYEELQTRFDEQASIHPAEECSPDNCPFHDKEEADKLIAELIQQIEKMKCCGNCKHYDPQDTHGCVACGGSISPERWQLKEV